jgi:hypothetical protein
MTTPKYLTTIFCDDVRREEGNKLSYMGVYVANLLVPTFPVVLPRLCFAMTMTTPAESPPTELRFCVYKDDEIVAQAEVPKNVLETARSAPKDFTDDQVIRIGTIFQLFPVQLTEKCRFRARAICDGEELKGGALVVEDFSLNALPPGSPGVLVPFTPISID